MGLLAETYYSTAALVKDDPLPPGRYWIDVFENGTSAWVGWSGGNLATVQIEKTEFYQGTSKVLEVMGWLYPFIPGQAAIPDRAFIIFNVTAPTPWDIEESVGWPNTAPKSIQTSSDTSTAQEVIDEMNKDEEDKWKWIKWGVFGTIGVVGLYSLARLVRG